jgi:hypothetical protein
MPTPILQTLSRTAYATDGVTTDWNFNFTGGYLDSTHVKAYTETPEGLRYDVVLAPADLVGSFQLRIKPALVAGNVLIIYRDTPKGLPIVNFTDEAIFSEVALDTNAKQAVFLAAEAADIISFSPVSAAIAAASNANISSITAAAKASEAGASAALASLQALAAAGSATAAANSAADASIAGAAASVAQVSALRATLASGLGGYEIGASLVNGPVITLGADFLKTLRTDKFGIAGDGVADNTTAFQALLNSGGDNLEIRVIGKVRITQDVTVTAKNLTIVGDGPGLSNIIFENNSGLRYVGGNAADYEYNGKQLQLRGLGFRTVGQSTSAVITVSYTGGAGGTSNGCTVDNCEITGVNASSGFAIGIDFDNARNVRIQKLRIMGDRGNNNPFSLVGIRVRGNSSPVEIFLDQITCYFVQTAVDVGGTTEGVYIKSCAFIRVYRGVFWQGSAAKPLLSMVGNHVNCSVAAVDLVDVVQFNISSNLFYIDLGLFAAPSVSNGIQIKVQAVVAMDSVINHNFIYFLSGGANKNGIVVLTGAGSETLLIDGNRFKAFDSGIVLQAGTEGVLVTASNQFNFCAGNVNDAGNNIVCIPNNVTPDGRTQSEDGTSRRFGSVVLTLDAAGNAFKTFTVPFKTGFLSGVVCNGDPNTLGTSVFSVRHDQCTVNGIAIGVRPPPGAGAGVRVNYSAEGY